MDLTVLQLGLFLIATFAAALVAGAGFAFALIAAAAWLHMLTPLQTVTLIISYGMLVQAYGFWKMRRGCNWSRFWPYIVGGAPGIAIGSQVLHWADPANMRMGIGCFFGALFDLRPHAAFAEADPGRHRRRYNRRFFQRPARRDGGLSGHHHRDLVHHARLDAGRSARRLSASQRCAAGDVRDLARRDRIDRAQHGVSVPGRASRTRARHLGRLPALRQDR